MKTVEVKLHNCFGIDEMNYTFDFSDENVYALYARNGLMKTSFAKTMQCIQFSKEKDIGDVIFGTSGTADVVIDGAKVKSKDIFVIKSYENAYESDISPLLIKDDVKAQLKEVLAARDKFLKALESFCGMKVKKTSGGKTVYEIETAILEDFGFSEKSILLNLDSLTDTGYELLSPGINYSAIFDPSAQKKISDDKFQDSIKKYIEGSEKVYESFGFLEKGNLTLPKLKEIKKSLENNSFFVKTNSMMLTGKDQINSVDDLSADIKEIDDAIKTMPEIKAIESLLGDAKGRILKDVIEVHTEIIPYLTKDNLPRLKKLLWASYINANKELFEDLRKKSKSLSIMIENVNIDDSLWKQALDIFNKRFSVPFSMTVSNLKGAIMGESIPRIEFAFEKDGVKKAIDRSRLEEIDTLSQGEKRALYLLNIIFDLEQLKASGDEKLLIIDDIADSFDYKNKYAIIEYLCELADDPKFKMIILTHNFDFYRTVISRIPIHHTHGLFAESVNNHEISVIQSNYQRQPFKAWKRNPIKVVVIALIPFVRNIIEFGKERNVSGTQKDADFLMLTSLLHEKKASNGITFNDILPVYDEYVGIKSFSQDVIMTDKIIDTLYKIADDFKGTSSALEYKIVLSIAIRHKAEAFMISEISKSSESFTWNKGRETGGSNDFLVYIEEHNNQTRELVNGYKKIGVPESVRTLSEVNIMTPENIHLNSFMFEPILDMDIIELLNLYQNVSKL